MTFFYFLLPFLLLIAVAIASPYIGVLLDRLYGVPSPVAFRRRLEEAIEIGQRLIDRLEALDFYVYGQLRKSTDQGQVIQLRDGSGAHESADSGVTYQNARASVSTALEREIEASLNPVKISALSCFSGAEVSHSVVVYPYGDSLSGGFKSFFESLSVVESPQSRIVEDLLIKLKGIRSGVPDWDITLMSHPSFDVISEASDFLKGLPEQTVWRPLEGKSRAVLFLLSIFRSKARSPQTLEFLSALQQNYKKVIQRLTALQSQSEVKLDEFEALFKEGFAGVKAGIDAKRNLVVDQIDGYIKGTEKLYAAALQAESTERPDLLVLSRLGSVKITLTARGALAKHTFSLLNVAFDYDSSVLLVEFYVPSVKTALDVYRAFGEKPTQKSLRDVAQSYLPALGLGLARKAVDYVEGFSVERVAINLKTEVVDASTGHVLDHYVFSALFPCERLKSLVLTNLNPLAACNKFQVRNETFGEVEQVISPLFRSEDDRIVEGRDVNSSLAKGQNLAALDWEDFEHLVRQLFERLFASKGATVSVTRASKDKGVDAIVFDPTPVTGLGKIVIQAKRYVNTVDVSAVRDLYGTVINEGATKGILVATSKFGPDALAFAEGKPLEFIDGNSLVSLMASVEMGNYRIDLEEARRILGLRPSRQG